MQVVGLASGCQRISPCTTVDAVEDAGPASRRCRDATAAPCDITTSAVSPGPRLPMARVKACWPSRLWPTVGGSINAGPEVAGNRPSPVRGGTLRAGKRRGRPRSSGRGSRPARPSPSGPAQSVGAKLIRSMPPRAGNKPAPDGKGAGGAQDAVTDHPGGDGRAADHIGQMPGRAQAAVGAARSGHSPAKAAT